MVIVAVLCLLWMFGCADETPEPFTPDMVESEGTDRGRWRQFRTHRFDESLDEEQRKMIRDLEAVGYVDGSVLSGHRQDVTIHRRDEVHGGLNFYTSGHAPEAILMDMDGEVLHRWRFDFWEAWPDYPVEKDHMMTTFWRRAYLYENGDILAIFEGLGLIKLDRDSNLIWANPGRAHHDLEVMPNGDIYVLTREAHLVPRIDKKTPILEDFISILDADGNEKRRLSLLRAFEQSEYEHFLRPTSKRRGANQQDIFHTNTLAVLDGSLASDVPAFRAGNVLVSMLKLDAIAVVDMDSGEVVWAQRGEFKKQHDPKVLANGNLLLFDNRGAGRRSTVLELDPVDGEIGWRYRGSDDDPFYSRTCGTAERLPNGNTLVTESDNGRAFELDPDGQVVWEFYNPQRAGEDDKYIATLFEVVRLPPDFPVDWIAGAGTVR